MNVYHATLNSYTWITLQLFFLFQLLLSNPSGTDPSRCELQLHLATQKGESK